MAQAVTQAPQVQSPRAMRFPTSKIWRAFPELDRFSDEQCGRFVAAVRRRKVGAISDAIMRIIAFVLAGIVWTLGLAVVFSAINVPSLSPRYENLWNLMSLLVVVSPIFVGAVFAMLVRDSLLRRRLRALLNDHLHCASCRYQLLGLHPDPNLDVTCPECGLVARVDPAIVHLACDDAGRSVIIEKPPDA